MFMNLFMVNGNHHHLCSIIRLIISARTQNCILISHGKSCSLQHLRGILICLTAIQFSCPFLQSSQFFFRTCTFSLSFNQGGLLFCHVRLSNHQHYPQKYKCTHQGIHQVHHIPWAEGRHVQASHRHTTIVL